MGARGSKPSFFWLTAAPSDPAQAWKTELKTLHSCVHPNVVQLIGSSSDGPALCLVYQFCAGGSLEQRLARLLPGFPPLLPKQRLVVLSDVVTQAHILSRHVISRHVLSRCAWTPTHRTPIQTQPTLGGRPSSSLGVRSSSPLPTP